MNTLFLSQLATVGNIPFVLSSISFREIIDVLIVSIAIYIVLLFVKQTKSYFVVIVSLVLIAIGLISQNLNLTLTRSILQPISTLTFIIIAIVFQREIRRFFSWIVEGKHHIFTRMKQISKNTYSEILETINYMAEKRIGAILVFEGKQDLKDFLEGGQSLDGIISKELLLSIFDTNSAGHDGAVIIEKDKIKKFGVHLPLARNYKNYRKAGTRHRAGTGITEDTDAIALIVSEERGEISIAKEGKIKVISGENELNKILKDLTGENEEKNQSFWYFFFFSNFKSKILAFLLAFFLWSSLVAQTGIITKEYIIPLSFQLLPSQYEISNATGKSQIDVTLRGKNTDINSFNPEKLEVKIDAKGFEEGNKEIKITPEMIVVPSFLSVIEINPETIYINIIDKQKEESVIDQEIGE